MFDYDTDSLSCDSARTGEQGCNFREDGIKFKVEGLEGKTKPFNIWSSQRSPTRFKQATGCSPSLAEA